MARVAALVLVLRVVEVCCGSGDVIDPVGLCVYVVVPVKCIGGAVGICCCILYEVFEYGLRCGLNVVGKMRYVVHVLC
jgi:hypothetical protein